MNTPNPLTLPDELLSPLTRTLHRNLLRWAAGNTLQCPKCRQVLDCRRTVIVTLKQGKVEKERVICSACWDSARTGFTSTAKAAGFQVEALDGREVFRR